MIFLCYVFLFLSVILLWFPNRASLWQLSLLLSICLGLLTNQLEWFALIPVGALIAALYMTKKGKRFALRFIAGCTVVMVGAGLGMVAHRFPGFHNLKILDAIHIGQKALPYTLYLNIDKTIVGILILGLSSKLISSCLEWLSLLKQITIKTGLVILVATAAAILLNLVQVDLKFPPYFFVWAITNLLLVCVAEEAFFREFIQKNLSLLMKNITYGSYVAWLISALIFGVAHYASGLKFMILATVAGCGYGWVYLTCKRIEGAILAHFSVNLIHIVFFTYPALVPLSN